MEVSVGHSGLLGLTGSNNLIIIFISVFVLGIAKTVEAACV